MLLTISTTSQPARDLGFLLGKHPDRFQRFQLSFGSAAVFFPEANDQRCEACLMLEVDTVDLVRGLGGRSGGGRSGSAVAGVDGYVNDRPYVASSLMSVAISRVLGTAIAGTCTSKPELAEKRLPLEARIDVLPAHGGPAMLESIFQPLGYEIECRGYPLDEHLPELGDSQYFSVTLRGEIRLQDLLSHLYVLIPVFDHHKHYFIGDAEVDKLLKHGEGWLSQHPKRDWIARRYLPYRHSLINEAIKRLTPETDEEEQDQEVEELTIGDSTNQDRPDPIPRLHELRLDAAVEQLLAAKARTVIDLGCGEGRLLKKLLAHKQFERLLGVDVCVRSLEVAARRLRLSEKYNDRMFESQSEPDDQRRIRLLHGALTYRDQRLSGFDAAALVEVIEHIDLERLPSLEQVVFQSMRYPTVVVTTPNQEYNVKFEGMPEKSMRHTDHRFEWTRSEFANWAAMISEKYHYQVSIYPVGPEDQEVGAPSQMAVFTFKESVSN